LKYRDPTGLTFGCCDPEYELLCDGDQGDNANPGSRSGGSSGNPSESPPENPEDTKEDYSGGDCSECGCMDDPEIKPLVEAKKNAELLQYSMDAFYFAVCFVAVMMLCGPLAVFCLFASGAVCSIAFGWLINESGKLSITDIHKKMEENGCSCSVYCS
jgi:hypothetical protein